MINFWKNIFAFLFLAGSTAFALTPRDLQTGRANHAFDHLGGIPEQAEAAAASGVNIIYATGIGGWGYQGLPPATELSAQQKAAADYLHRAKNEGIRGAIAYVCATSIVKLETFDKNWPAALRAQFSTPPSEWLQRNRANQPLPSWYGGDYRPACMNNPDWRRYEKYIVRLQIESGHDGIFFDNPTVHPEGCYCEYCLKKFKAFIEREKQTAPNEIAPLRHFALDHPNDFLRFRGTIAADFMADIRAYARTLNPNFLITCNNSLNTPDALFSQARTYGYNIYEMSKVEDLVVIEDMATQPRVLPGGQTVEYGHTYSALHAISHNKPIVVCTIADADYHTAPNLVRLAMAEAAAHNASYLSWPTWPENERPRMASTIRPESDFLRDHADLFVNARPRADVLLFFPFREWSKTATCRAWQLSVALTQAGIQYDVVCEDDFIQRLKKEKTATLLMESPAVLTKAEAEAVAKFKLRGGQVAYEIAKLPANRSITLQAPPTVRAVVNDQPHRTVVHLLNLNIQKLTSFTDKVTPAENIHVSVKVPFKYPHKVKVLTTDADATQGELKFTTDHGMTEFTIPHLAISTIVVIE